MPSASNVHPFLVFSVGGYQGAVCVQNGFLEEGLGLLFPHTHPNSIVDILKLIDVALAETSTEIAGKWSGRDASAAEGIAVDVVKWRNLDVLQTGAVAQGIVSDVEHMIGFVIRQVDLEQVDVVVDGVNEADASSEQVKGAKAAVGNAVDAFGDFVVDVAGGEDGSGAIPQSSGGRDAVGFRIGEQPADRL